MKKKEELFREYLSYVSTIVLVLGFVFFIIGRYIIINYDCFSVSDNIILKISSIIGILLSFRLLYFIKNYNSKFSFSEFFTVSGLFGFFLMIVGFSLLINTLIRIVNTFDFYSEVKIIKEIVSGSDQKAHIRKDRRSGDKSYFTYYLKVENNSKLFDDGLVEVDLSIFTKAYFGDELIFKVKPGFLGFPRKSGKFEIKYNYEYEKAVEKRDREAFERYRQEEARKKKR